MSNRSEAGPADWFQSFLTSHPVRWVALLFLCSPYLVSASAKVSDFSVGIDEMTRYGMLPAAPYAAIVTLIQLGCSVMILTGFLRWIGALMLAAFTLAATCVAEPFWNALPAQRPMQMDL
ncbi:MAG: DoxX family protein, partial [Rhizobiaceae bacterium]|nr:DoxX family protein [Rhizobiaceae bacterium]